MIIIAHAENAKVEVEESEPEPSNLHPVISVPPNPPAGIVSCPWKDGPYTWHLR